MNEQKSVESEPAFAKELFGDRIEVARRYVSLLARDSDTFGLLGPRELSQLWSRHVLSSALLSELVKPGQAIVDIGSGAGLPGIPMAIAAPDCKFTLVEPMERRSNWLSATIFELGLTNVEVVRARAEDLQRTDFDVATARAVAALDKLVRLLSPLIRGADGKTILALKGSKAPQEIEDASGRLELLGFGVPEILTLGLGKAPETATVVRIRLKA
ncbi:MAG: 16S rRNA (guanine(527)-N(7))-methyltransferase RsmG [Aquiluna sp.]|nr:16S rRNA (guanine(527)-N(7))-methyltransferase RsmG [Aquiluna sp.]